MNYFKEGLILIVIYLSLISCGSSPKVSIPDTAEQMPLESSAFKAGQPIPTEFTCDGTDQSPPLTWNAPPSGTKSLVLIMDDPDAPFRTFVHWVVYDIPPTVEQFDIGMGNTETLLIGGVQGKNGFDKIGYGGPCPPSGTHRYFFKLYALDKKLNLPVGVSKSEVLKAMDGHILGVGELMGRYEAR